VHKSIGKNKVGNIKKVNKIIRNTYAGSYFRDVGLIFWLRIYLEVLNKKPALLSGFFLNYISG